MTKAKKYQLNRGAQTKCPHCGSNCQIRTSREIDTLSRDVYFMCRDVECGHQFVAQMTIKHSIVASRTPRAGLMLPLILPAPALPKPANDDTAPGHRGVPANDDEGGDPAASDAIMTTPG